MTSIDARTAGLYAAAFLLVAGGVFTPSQSFAGTCVLTPATITVSPADVTAKPGDVVNLEVKITNNNSADCPTSGPFVTFTSRRVNTPDSGGIIVTGYPPRPFQIAAGESYTYNLKVTIPPKVRTGSHPGVYTVGADVNGTIVPPGPCQTNQELRPQMQGVDYTMIYVPLFMPH